jgi:hypothetical protein
MPAEFRSVSVITALLVLGATAVLGYEPVADGNGVTADPGFPARAVCTRVDPAATTGQVADVIPQPGHCSLGAKAAQTGGVALDSLSVQAGIPSLHRYAVYVDHTDLSLAEIELPDLLTALAHQAVERAPGWLQEELADNLAKFEPGFQDTLAQLILDADDPYVDEIAYEVARMATVSLTNALFSIDLIVENAQLIYEHDQTLQYVEVVDHGSAAAGGDYYSTTRYRVVDAGDTVWVEIPREMYYWYVVHPKISDEIVKKSSEQDPRQSTYGYFWRNYFFSNPDSVYDYSDSVGTPGVYPVLGEVLALPTVFWDGQQHDLPFGRSFDAEDLAVDIIGNWLTRVVPYAASGNRPIQPNQIIYEHNGNCGELQDALCAAARTALIPAVCISDHCEDHVWNEFFLATPDGDWHPYQTDLGGGGTHIDNPYIAYDRDHGGSKDISGVWAWRGDGYTYAVVDRYSKYCTLVVHVEDANGKPVDGALVLLWSEGWGGAGLSACIWAYTDARGFCTMDLGDLQDYYLHVNSSVGDYPQGDLDQVVQVIDDSQSGQGYYKSVTLEGEVTRYACVTDSTQGDAYQLRVVFDAPHEIIYGNNLYGDDPDFAKWEQPGELDFFLCDSANFALLEQGADFCTAVVAEDVGSGEVAFVLPDMTTDWYVVFSNEDHVVNKQRLDAEISLCEYIQDVADSPVAPLRLCLTTGRPNPFAVETQVLYSVPGSGAGPKPHVSLVVYSLCGRRVRALTEGEVEPGWHWATWDGTGDSGLPVPSGVYVCRLAAHLQGGRSLVAARQLTLSR